MTAFLDTNVLVYAQGEGSKSEKARQVVLEGGIVSVQVLNELTNVLKRKFDLDWNEIAEVLEDVKTALDPVRPIGLETHVAALDLSRDNGFNFYDSLIIAAALEADCDQLLTEDLQAGRRIEGLVIVNPFAS
ncbi:MAG: PIN domain-containing protein [Gammaproteobacteria bacterium]|nr:PIN domain-containing protein [Gammaproteobacteria bacterium]MDE0270532.1 PIN domain-containing protein [Gammaproteobacteria bacterium]